MRGNSTFRWLIFAPVAILALFAPTANAQSQPGLLTRYYTIDEVPPVKSDLIYTECGSEVENNINRSYDGEPYLECTYDLFMVHMTGAIIIPEHDTIEFWLATDDGGTIKIGTNEWGNWGDQGCTWMESGQIDISAGNQPLDLWMYENGGGTCVMLAWNIDNTGWVIVPDEAFTTNGIPTTTTIQETTTSWESTTTSTTTTTTTSTIAPSTTVPVEPEPTTTILQTTTTLPPDTTVPAETTTVPEPETTEPIVTIPPETSEAPPTIVDTVPDTLPPDTLPDAPETLETVPNTIVDEIPEELVQALQDASGGNVTLTDEQFADVLDILDNLTDSEAVVLIGQILDTAVTAEQATELASNPDVLDVITESQAEEIFDAIDVGELSPDEITALVEAVQGAPERVRNAFENTINVFGDGFGDYVPLGSNVPVDTRRTLIAVAVGAATVAVGSRRNK